MGRIKTEKELMERAIKMLPKGIPADAIASVEIDNWDGWNGYWIYLRTGWKCEDTECHTIHEDTLKMLKYMIGRIQPWEDDPWGGYISEEERRNRE